MAKKAKSKHVLVIRLSAMGDVAITVPVIIALKENHPEIEITVLTKPHFTSIFHGIHGISTIGAEVNGEHKGFFGLWKLFKSLKGASITHVADLHNVLRSKILSFFFKCHGIEVATLNKGRAEKRALTRTKNKRFVQLKTTIERYREVFQDLGITLLSVQDGFLPKPKLSESAKKFFSKKNYQCVGIAPFAAHNSKMYRLDLMEQVIRQLILKGDYNILLFGGGKNEIEQLKSFESRFDGNVQSIAGKLNFDEELALISHLDVMLAMDSGNGHLAANYGIPVITVWGVTHPFAGFSPHHQPPKNAILPDGIRYPLIPTSVYGNRCPEGYEDAIDSIAPNTIVKRVLEVLGES